MAIKILKFVVIFAVLFGCGKTSFRSTGLFEKSGAEDPREDNDDDANPKKKKKQKRDEDPDLTCKLEVSARSIILNSSVTIKITGTGEIGEAYIGGDLVKIGEAITKTPTSSTSYEGKVVSKDQKKIALCKASVNVNIPDAPTCTFATPITSIRIENSVSGTVKANGTYTSIRVLGTTFTPNASNVFSWTNTPLVGTNTSTFFVTFMAEVSNNGKSNTCLSDPITVRIPPMPTCNLSGPTSVFAGAAFQITMSKVGEVKSALFQNNNVTLPLPKTFSPAPITQARTYVGRVFTYGRTTSSPCSHTVSITPPIPAPTCGLTFTPSNSVLLNDPVTVKINKAAGSSAANAFFINDDPVNEGEEIDISTTAAGTFLVKGKIQGPSGESTCNQNLTVNLPSAPSCVVTTDQTSIRIESEVTGTFRISGVHDESTIKLFENTSAITFTRVGAGNYTWRRRPVVGSNTTSFDVSYRGEVSGPGGDALPCTDVLRVNIPTQPTCSITANRTSPVLAGDDVTVTMNINGTYKSAVFDGAAVPPLSKTITNFSATRSFSGSVTGYGRAPRSCTGLTLQAQIPNPEPDIGACVSQPNGLIDSYGKCPMNTVLVVVNNGTRAQMSCCDVAPSLFTGSAPVERDQCNADEVGVGMGNYHSSGLSPSVWCARFNTSLYHITAQENAYLLTQWSQDPGGVFTDDLRALVGRYNAGDTCVCRSKYIVTGPHTWNPGTCSERCVLVEPKP